MHTWCSESDLRLVPTGEFWEARIMHLEAIDLHIDEEFMAALALKVMSNYESVNEDDETLFLPETVVTTADRTKAFYDPLFRVDGTYKPEFVTEASETLGMWIEQAFGEVSFVKRGDPHNSDYGFDGLSIVARDEQYLRIVQVKATPSNLYGRCREAATKFGGMHRGTYAAALKAKLESMRHDDRVPDDIDLDEIFLRRRYRVIAVHEEEREGVTLLSNFADEVPGDAAVRSLRLVRVVWLAFWDTLAGKVYEQLR